MSILKSIIGIQDSETIIETTYLGNGTNSEYEVNGAGLIVIAGMRTSSSNPVLTTAAVNGSAVQFQTVFYGGGDWKCGTSTLHKVGVYSYFEVPPGRNTVSVYSSSSSEFQFFLKGAKSIRYAQSNINSRSIQLNPGEAVVTAISSEKNACTPAQSSVMSTVYRNNDQAYAYKDATEAGLSGYITTTTYGRGGYAIFTP